MRYIVSVSCMFLFLSATASGTTCVVEPDGSGDYPTIQAAINAVSQEDTILLANGTFTGSQNRNIDYFGRAITVRSESGVPDSCIIDCEEAGRGFYFHSSEGPGSALEGVTIANGTANQGGGVRCHNSSPSLANCTFSNNSANVSGGGMYCLSWGRASATLQNTIIAFCPEGEAIYCAGSSNANLTCCDVFGNVGGDWVGGIADQNGVNGNISEDPRFVCHPDTCDTADFHLRWGSPCIDAGDTFVIGLPEFDFDAQPRIMDGDSNDVAIVDIGADEFPGPIFAEFVRADVQADGDHDLFDALYLLNWLGGINPAPSCVKTADIQDDGDADLFDALYLLNWLGGINPAPPAPCCDIPSGCGPDPTADELTCVSYPLCE